MVKDPSTTTIFFHLLQFAFNPPLPSPSPELCNNAVVSSGCARVPVRARRGAGGGGVGRCRRCGSAGLLPPRHRAAFVGVIIPEAASALAPPSFLRREGAARIAIQVCRGILETNYGTGTISGPLSFLFRPAEL